MKVFLSRLFNLSEITVAKSSNCSTNSLINFVLRKTGVLKVLLQSKRDRRQTSFKVFRMLSDQFYTNKHVFAEGVDSI